MATQSPVSDLLSRAWNYQRDGRSDAAITEFQKIIQQYPKDIDANYGLALAQKAVGQKEAAVATFRVALDLIDQSKQAYEASRERTADTDNIKTPEDDRFQMLDRMVKQRLAELEQK
ncbi:MAG: tetratricopeptide repeat protein [Anaerolineae bacterium]|nr:tetratricopeptide repeat protein [Anaerolineae bacterium]